jgi:hypothetical protein
MQSGLPGVLGLWRLSTTRTGAASPRLLSRIVGQCQAHVRLAMAAEPYAEVWLFPRGTAVVFISRNGQSVMTRTRMGR